MNQGVVRISSGLRDEMLKHILSWLPEEACGLLAGKDGRVTRVFPVENAEHSPVRFRMDPEQQVRAFEQIEDRELELLAIFHSHPMGPAGLSATDLAEAAYPDVWHVIWSRQGGEWLARAYVLEAREAREVLLVTDDETGPADPG